MNKKLFSLAAGITLGAKPKLKIPKPAETHSGEAEKFFEHKKKRLL